MMSLLIGIHIRLQETVPLACTQSRAKSAVQLHMPDFLGAVGLGILTAVILYTVWIRIFARSKILCSQRPEWPPANL